MGSLPSGIVTFFFSDIEGSTRRWMEDPAMAASLALHDELTRTAIDAASGRVVKHTGDGVMAVFASPSAAVAAAADLQRSLLVAEWRSQPLRVRIGLHTGEAEPVGDDYFGADVSTTARVMGAAHAGQVLVSGATEAVAARHLPPSIGLRELGSFQLPDIDRPIRLFQVVAPTIPDEFPPPRSRETTPTNLPAETTSFVGRHDEIAAVRDLVRTNRLVTLTGVGGAGKTRLALRVAREVLVDHPDGVWLVPLAATTDGDDVPDRVVESLRVPDGPGTAAERVRAHVGGRRLLVVMDNCEHLLDDVAHTVQLILEAGERVAVLATSREALGIGGEVAWRVPSLAVTAGDGDGDGGDAVSLFIERASEAAPGFTASEEDSATIREICSRLDGIPLAIELAAARVRSLGVDQVRDRLDDRFRILTGGSRTALPRQRTLAATIEWSYRLLDPAEQQLLARLSVFAGGFDLDAAESICSWGDVEAIDVLDRLPSLVDKSMVVADPAPAGRVRYRLLETIRQFAAEHLDDDVATALRDRHARWYAEHLASDSNALLMGRTGPLVADVDNLEAGLEWVDASVEPAVAGRLAHAVSTAALAIGEERRALDVVERALAAVPGDADAVSEALLRSRRAALLVRTPNARSEAVLEATRARGLAAALSSNADRILVLLRLGSVARMATEVDPAEAVDLSRAAVDAADALGDPRLRVDTLRQLAESLAWSGHPDEGEATGLEALSLAERLGDRPAIRGALGTLQFATLGRPDAYRRHTERLLAEFPVEEEPSGAADGDVFWSLVRAGRLDEAERSRVAHVGSRSLEGWERAGNLVGRSMVGWMQGHLDRADTDLRVLLGEPFIERWAHDIFPLMADIAADRGELDRVHDALDRHLSMDVHASEVPMRAGVVFPHVRAEVESVIAGRGGDLACAEASIRGVRDVVRSRDHHLSIQIEPPHAYLALAEAELTRATGPIPDAWQTAIDATATEYWRTYAQLRCAEASATTGSGPFVDVDAAIGAATRMGAHRLVELGKAVVRAT